MEFAYGTLDETHPFPIPANPWNTKAWPGGSSSGTAAEIAADMMLGGLGTDTCCSVRLPAAMCGISGIKPTFDLVPTSGCVSLAFSADHIGPLARTARYCAIPLAVMTERAVPAPRLSDEALIILTSTGSRRGNDCA